MKAKEISKEEKYNMSLDRQSVTRSDSIDPKEYRTLQYSKPQDEFEGIKIELGNQRGGFPFMALGHEWRSVEHLYLCGEWSLATPEHKAIQEDIRTATSGYAAKRYKRSKYKSQMRKDKTAFHTDWMIWCIWQKCLGNEAFRNHLLSMPKDRVIVEVIKDDPTWAAWPDANGVLQGCNGVGKILTICRNCLEAGTEPEYDKELLNRTGIYILGERVQF